MLPAAELARRFAELGATGDAPVGAYCGSGVTASALVLAAEHAGLRPPEHPVALYAGSWSDWSPTRREPSRPASIRETVAPMSPRAAVVWTPEFLTYDLGDDHPLDPVRLDLTMRLARELGVLEGVELIAPEPAPDAEVQRIHVPSYLDRGPVGARGAVRHRPRAGHRRQPDLLRDARGQRADLRRFAALPPRRSPRGAPTAP